MPAVELTLFGLGLGAACRLAQDVATGVLGNVAHDVTKLGVRSLLTRMEGGEIAANHDVLRACRRASLLATYVAARQFGHARRDEVDAVSRWEVRWADHLAASRFEEVQQTLDASYWPPPSALGTEAESLLGLMDAALDLEGALHELAVREVLAELAAWHQREARAHGWSEPALPSPFAQVLEHGWRHVEIPDSVAAKVSKIFTKRRGEAARTVSRSQQAIERPANGNVTWFGAFAAFFAEELKQDQRAQFVVTSQLLLQINQRLQAVDGGPGGLEADDLVRMITRNLACWGEEVCEQGERLHTLAMRALAEHRRELLDELIAQRTRAERDGLLLRQIAAATTRIEQRQGESIELLHGIQEQLAALAAEKGVAVPPLQQILRRLGELNVPVERIPERLERAADELVALRAQWQSVALPEVEQVRAHALALLERDGDLEGARALLREVRARVRAQREDRSREEATLLGDEAKVDVLELRYLDAADKYAQAVELVRFDAEARFELAIAYANSLHRQGDELGDNDALVREIAALRELVLEYTRERVPLQWAMTQNNLGNALSTLGERESGTARLEQAVAAYRAALEECTRERVPLQWAMTQNNLGNALRTLGERESGTARLEQAVAAYRAALEEYTRERVPLQWAMTQNNLGNALRTLGERESGTARLEQAVAAYRAALEECTRERVPLQWAMTQNNLGNALRTLGERESGTARLEQAVAAYRAALEEYTRERVPLQWAMTQNNLGNALRTLGERESGTARLEQAVTAYRAALEEYTRERVPLQWATTQNNLGTALWTLGERESGTARLEQAVAAYRAALEECTRERVPLQWAMTQNNLGTALRTLGQRESGTARLEQAVTAYRAALEEYTRERVPLQWATTQNNLGTALWTLGERESGTARLEQAVAAYRAALEECTRERVPLQWAMTQNNLGTALSTLGERESGTARLEQAVAAYRAALAVFEAALGSDHAYSKGARAALAALLGLLGQPNK